MKIFISIYFEYRQMVEFGFNAPTAFTHGITTPVLRIASVL
jgi:hypothetical protein